MKGTRNKKTVMWEEPLGTQQSETMVNNILSQTSKLELAQYLHAALFIPTTVSLLKAINQGFLKMWPGLTETIINKHHEKSSNKTMGHMRMGRQEMQSTK